MIKSSSDGSNSHLNIVKGGLLAVVVNIQVKGMIIMIAMMRLMMGMMVMITQTNCGR